MRLIDADALLKDQYIIDASGTVYGRRDYVTLNEIENAPTIEPEQKNGKWIKVEKVFHTRFHSDQPDTYHEYRCTGCLKASDKATNYCPNCGSKMEE